MDRAQLDILKAAIAHRGPDGFGLFANDSVGLLNTRLAIVDLNFGDQPFSTASGLVSVANGEIYNDIELRRELVGTNFASHSDCETPLHLFCRDGMESFDALRGMYALAIYDTQRNRTVLARDPFGIKPLYYASTPAGMAFASEAQALIAAGFASRRIDGRRRAELLQLKFTTGNQTIFSDIKRVLPGERLVISDGDIVERTGSSPLTIDPNVSRHGHPEEKLQSILAESVHAHLRADVPYGLFLSGGIDSSVLATLMARESRVLAFTAAFPDLDGRDEREAAERVSKAVGAEQEIVSLTTDDFWRSAPQVAAALDDPTTDAASLPTFLLAERAKACGIKVVLSGEGADEVFGGYSRYRRAVRFYGLLGRASRTRGVFDGIGEPSSLAHWRDGLADTERELNGHGRQSLLQRLQAIDCAEWLPNDLLTKLDRCLMAHGVEGRTPFVDPIVGPFAWNLPDDLKVKRGFGKWILRDWLSRNCPAAEAFAKKKGFNPPVGIWIAQCREALAPLVRNQPGIAELGIADAVGRVLANADRDAQPAWSLVFYALWHSRHVLDVAPDGTIGDVLAAAAARG